MGFLSNFFNRGTSGSIAKERIQLAIMADRMDLSQELMESLRQDIIGVIRKYVEIDETRIELDFEQEDSSVALVANIPVMTVRRRRRRS